MKPKEKVKFLFELAAHKVQSQLLPSNKPNLFIVGAQKAGTTSLHSYLKQHQLALASVPKELNYFDRQQFYGKSTNWYEKHFVTWSKEKRIVFEATPNYLYDPLTAEAIHAYNPNSKIIIALRNPIDRAYSAWNMYRDIFDRKKHRLIHREKRPNEPNPLYDVFHNNENFPSFLELIELEVAEIKNGNRLEPAILRRGLYAEQIERYHNHFKAENILILGFKELTQHPLNTMNRICRFLEIPEFTSETLNTQPRNVRSYNSKISDDALAILSEFYAEPNERLKQLIGTIPPW